MSKAEAFLVVVIALVAIASVAFFIYYEFPDTLVGEAIYGENCGCVDAYQPVCSDGITYQNLCVAKCNKKFYFTEGICS